MFTIYTATTTTTYYNRQPTTDNSVIVIIPLLQIAAVPIGPREKKYYKIHDGCGDFRPVGAPVVIKQSACAKKALGNLTRPNIAHPSLIHRGHHRSENLRLPGTWFEWYIHIIIIIIHIIVYDTA